MNIPLFELPESKICKSLIEYIKKTRFIRLISQCRIIRSPPIQKVFPADMRRHALPEMDDNENLFGLVNQVTPRQSWTTNYTIYSTINSLGQLIHNYRRHN